MNELQRIVEDMQTVFADSAYPKEFLAAYDQMECLASHKGRETFLVRRKSDGEMAVAACYDRTVFPFRPNTEILKELTHPGLPRYYEEYQNEQMLCTVREYIEGEPLAARAAECQLSIEEIVSIVSQLCDILEVLHTHEPPIVHRDIKPENVILRPDGRVVLIDFDIARTVRENASADTVFFGTRGYAPPEQYGFGQTDTRADIYALGVLLRVLVTGSVRENKNITINPGIQKVIDRCTAFTPEERYTDIREVKEALEGAGRKRRRVRPAALGGMLLALLAFLCAGFAVGRYTEWLRPVPKIIFQEPLIEEAVRLQLGKKEGSLTEEELGQVSRLYIYGTEALKSQEDYDSRRIDESTKGPVRTLDDLALLPNLEELYMANQGYVDVTGISGLTKLYTAELKHMRISGAAPVAGAPSLKHAILFDTGLSDATAFEKCPWLETLDIGLNDITSLAEIGRHPNVRSLGLMWLKMKDLDEIAERLPKVQAVTLQHGEFQDLTGLAALPDLEAVYVLEEQREQAEEALAGTDVRITVTEN